ncbi:hypothetical protein L7F22_066561 [Adiantum nelumboides]|nr:hypothetical protein [Adiantum nelumboides]
MAKGVTKEEASKTEDKIHAIIKENKKVVDSTLNTIINRLSKLEKEVDILNKEREEWIKEKEIKEEEQKRELEEWKKTQEAWKKEKEDMQEQMYTLKASLTSLTPEEEMTNADFNMFLQSIDRVPVYVDFEAVVTVGKDQPPDLAGFAMESTTKPATPDNKQSIAVVQNSSSRQDDEARSNMPVAKSKVLKNEKDGGVLQKLVRDPHKLLNHILDETIRATMTKVIKDSGDKELELSISNEIKSQITPDLESIMILFKNTTYTQGFVAGFMRSRNIGTEKTLR